MSLNGIMQTALTGLFTSQSALRITSSNIANVNTEGYARQVVRQEPVIAGSTPAGVRIADVERIVDRFLEASALSSSSEATRYSTERQFHDRIQALLGRPDLNTSLSGRLDSMFQKLGALAQDPTQIVLRQDALSGIQDFANEISRLSDEVQNLRADASNQISEKVTTINALIKRIDQLNPEIVREEVVGGETGALKEQRSQALSQLAKLVDIRAHDQPDGSVQVTTVDGTVLLGGVRVELKYSSPGSVTSETQFSPITAHNVDPNTGELDTNGAVIDGSLRGGELKGLLNMRDNTLPDMAAELGRLGTDVMGEINAIHNTNSAYPPPNSLTGTNSGLLGSDAHGFAGEAAFVVTDNTGTVVARSDVDFDALAAGTPFSTVIANVNAALGGAGTVALNNGTLSFNAANANHGVAVSQDPNDPAVRGGKGLSDFFGLNDLIAAKVSGQYATGFKPADDHGFTPGGSISFNVIGPNNSTAQSYTQTIAPGDFNSILSDLNGGAALGDYFTFTMNGDGEVTATPKPGFEDFRLTVKSDSTARGGTSRSFSQIFGIGERYLADAASGMAVLNSFVKNPGLMAVGRFEHNTAVGSIGISAGDNEGAQALQSLELAVRSVEAAGDLGAFNGTLSQYGASILSNMGLKAQQATSSETDKTALANEIASRKSDVQGVNLDEELSNMVIYQNSYNASARIISTVRELYDTLLNVV